MRRYLPLIAAALLAAAVPVLATSDAAPDEAEHNRRLLDHYRRDDPRHYNELLQDLRDFQALPPDRQERMRQFDRALHDEPADEQNRLWEVLERYTDWVERLPADQRQRVEQAPDRDARLAIVKELRQQQWIAAMPRADREAVMNLPEPRRSDAVAQFVKEERQRRKEWVDWAAALRARPDAPNPRPARADGLPDVSNKVLNDFLKNELTADEQRNLHLRGLDRAERHEVLLQAYFKKHPNLIEEWRLRNQKHAR